MDELDDRVLTDQSIGIIPAKPPIPPQRFSHTRLTFIFACYAGALAAGLLSIMMSSYGFSVENVTLIKDRDITIMVVSIFVMMLLTIAGATALATGLEIPYENEQLSVDPPTGARDRSETGSAPDTLPTREAWLPARGNVLGTAPAADERIDP